MGFSIPAGVWRGLGCGWLVLGLASVALGQDDDPLSVRWSAPPTCADAQQVEARIRSRVAHFEPGTVVDVDVLVTRKRASVYLVHIRLGGALAGERRLETESCDAAVEATALLVAIAIDPTHLSSGPGEPAHPVGTSAPTTAPNDQPPAPADQNREESLPALPDPPIDNGQVTDAPSKRVPAELPAGREAVAMESDDAWAVGFELGAGLPVDWGSTPGVTFGAQLSAALSIERVLFNLAGTALLAKETAIGTDATLSASWTAAAFDGCYVAAGPIQWGPCLGMEAGQLVSTTRGLVGNDGSSETAISATASMVARAQLTSAMYAAIWVSMRTPVWYPRLLVVGVGEAFRPAVVGARAIIVLTVVLG